MAGLAVGLDVVHRPGADLDARRGRDERRPGRGAALLAAYALGSRVPFLVVGLAFGRFVGPLAWVRHLPAITAGSALLLGVFGVCSRSTS